MHLGIGLLAGTQRVNRTCAVVQSLTSRNPFARDCKIVLPTFCWVQISATLAGSCQLAELSCEGGVQRRLCGRPTVRAANSFDRAQRPRWRPKHNWSLIRFIVEHFLDLQHSWGRDLPTTCPDLAACRLYTAPAASAVPMRLSGQQVVSGRRVAVSRASFTPLPGAPRPLQRCYRARHGANGGSSAASLPQDVLGERRGRCAVPCACVRLLLHCCCIGGCTARRPAPRPGAPVRSTQHAT